MLLNDFVALTIWKNNLIEQSCRLEIERLAGDCPPPSRLRALLSRLANAANRYRG